MIEEENEMDWSNLSEVEDELSRLVKWENETGSKGAEHKIKLLRERVEYLKTKKKVKLDLSIKELEKGYDAFEKIKNDSQDKRTSLESELIKEVRLKGHSSYSHALSNSIELETTHINNATNKMNEYRDRIIIQSRT